MQKQDVIDYFYAQAADKSADAIDAEEFGSRLKDVRRHDYNRIELVELLKNISKALDQPKNKNAKEALREQLQQDFFLWVEKMEACLPNFSWENLRDIIHTTKKLGVRTSRGLFKKLVKKTQQAFLASLEDDEDQRTGSRIAQNFSDLCAISKRSNKFHIPVSFMTDMCYATLPKLDQFDLIDCLKLLRGFETLNTIPPTWFLQSYFNRIDELIEETLKKITSGELEHAKNEAEYALQILSICSDKGIRVPSDTARHIRTLTYIHDDVIAEKYYSVGMQGFAIQSCLTGDNGYGAIAKRFHDLLEEKKLIPTLPKEACRRAGHACMWFGIETKIKIPKEDDSPSYSEGEFREILTGAGIKISDMPLIIPGTGHKVDFNLTASHEGAPIVGCELDADDTHLTNVMDDENPDITRKDYNGKTIFQSSLNMRCLPGARIFRIPVGPFKAAAQEEGVIVGRWGQRLLGSLFQKAAGDYILAAVYGKRGSPQLLPIGLHDGRGQLGYDPAEHNFARRYF